MKQTIQTGNRNVVRLMSELQAALVSFGISFFFFSYYLFYTQTKQTEILSREGVVGVRERELSYVSVCVCHLLSVIHIVLLVLNATRVEIAHGGGFTSSFFMT